jgi:hypothetical protein
VIAAAVFTIIAVSFFAMVSFNAILKQESVMLHQAAVTVANHIETLYDANWQTLTSNALSPDVSLTYVRSISEFGTERLVITMTADTPGGNFTRNFLIERVVAPQ